MIEPIIFCHPINLIEFGPDFLPFRRRQLWESRKGFPLCSYDKVTDWSVICRANYESA
jgi:hypothetical protein